MSLRSAVRNLASPRRQCEDGNGFALSMGTRAPDADRWNQPTRVQPSILSSDAISVSFVIFKLTLFGAVYSGHPSRPNQPVGCYTEVA